MKRTIRLRESELKRMVSESVKRVINEWYTLPGDALHADASVVPIIRGAIKKAYDLGSTECNINK